MGDGPHVFALAHKYGALNEPLLQRSHQTLYSCQRTEDVVVIEVKDIISVVAMVPHVQDDNTLGSYDGRVFAVERIGLDVLSMSGTNEREEGEDLDE